MHAELTVEAGRDVGRVFVVRLGQSFTVGRGSDVAITIDDERVSRRHAALELRPEGLFVTDLGSRNGTFILGRPLTANQPLLTAPGDVLELGAHRLRLDIQGLDERSRRERQRTQRLDEPLLPQEEFELLGEIGRGATGRVYAARQRLLDRLVAVKVLRSDLGEDEEGQRRFLREARVCVKIDSPYVVQVHDVRMVYGRACLIMELINGPSAKDRLAGGALPIAQVVRIGLDVANALQAAHKVGVVHRDIKPANILLVPDGPAKLSDFGIAKELDSVESLTATGEGLGTLAYVSPEQATEARSVTPKTDLYGLGATLYHLAAGRPPFLPTSAKVLLEIMDRPPPPVTSFRPDCPSDLAALIHQLLEKDPARRPASAAAAGERLLGLHLRHLQHRKGPTDLGRTSDLSDDIVTED
ncbi:MAG: protein kinase [Planctomycetes bacterium]|nr:protein kinase [Planctomycetota bacterium]